MRDFYPCSHFALFYLTFRQKSLGCTESRECPYDRSVFSGVSFAVLLSF